MARFSLSVSAVDHLKKRGAFMANLVTKWLSKTWISAEKEESKPPLKTPIFSGSDDSTGTRRVTELEAFLMEEHGALLDLNLERRQEARRAIFDLSPFGPLTLQVCNAQSTPRQAFIRLLEIIPLDELLNCHRLLSDHLALAVTWDDQGESRLASSLMGLLLRLGLAGGAESLVVRTVTRLNNIEKRDERCSELSMSAESLKKVRRAWRVWGTSPQTSNPQALMRLARIIRRNNDVTDVQAAENDSDENLNLDEIAVLERLLNVSSSPGFKLAPGQKARVLLRLMELYSSPSLSWAETGRRGLNLLPMWAEASVQRDVAPNNIERIIELATLFTDRLTASGVSNPTSLTSARLHQVLYRLEQRWHDHSSLSALYLKVGNLQRELVGDTLDTTALERVTMLFVEGQRLSGENTELRRQLSEASMETAASWLRTGDAAAIKISQQLLAKGSQMETSVAGLIAMCEVYLNTPGTQRQQHHNAHRCRQLADKALSHVDIETMPVKGAQALLLKSLASLKIFTSHKQRSLHKILGWLRRSVAILTRQLKRSRNRPVESLLGRALLALSHSEMTNASRLSAQSRAKALRQASRDCHNAKQVFIKLGLAQCVAEAIWLQGQILMLSEVSEAPQQHLNRPSDWIEIVKTALNTLGNSYGAQNYTGQHTGQLRLSDMLRHDLVQSMTILSSPGENTDINIETEPRERTGEDKNEKSAPRQGTPLKHFGIWNMQVGAIA